MAQKKTSKAKQTKSNKKAKKQDKQTFMWERLAAASLFFFLSMFIVLDLFGIDAVIINLLGTFIKTCIGYGIWLTAPAFLFISYLLFFRHKESIRLRIVCIFFIPIIFSALLHIFFAVTDYTADFQGFLALADDGKLLASGGCVSGYIAVLLSQLFSSIATTFILFILLLLLCLGSFHISPQSLIDSTYDAYKSHRERQEEKEAFIDQNFENIPNTQNKKPKQKTKPIFFQKSEIINEPKLNDVAHDISSDITVKTTHLTTRPEPISEEAIDTTLSSEFDVLPDEPELTKREQKEQIKEEQIIVTQDIANSLKNENLSEYDYPSMHFLHEPSNHSNSTMQGELLATQKRLSETIQSFGIVATISGAVHGPSVTRYEVELEQGVRLNKLTNLSDDIALALGASSVRIAPVPGKISLVGIEVPNQSITPVWIREVLSSKDFTAKNSKVSFAVGKDIGGNYIVGDIAKLPHLLIAGTTGSGKSVCTNSLIISMLYKASPKDVRLIMIDPKMVELGIYNGIPHLLIPVVTDPKKAAGALQWTVSEMMKRYRIFSEAGVRDLASYNAYANEHEDVESLPQIVVVIDELADLMLVAAKEVEESICRVAQMGRASGIHLIIATQRPSADVITGLMKANIPSRIAFAVASSLESRIILDTQGAEKLVGKGDMLWFPLGSGKPLRVQGCLIDDHEVSTVVSFVKQSADPSYDESIIQEIEQHAAQEKQNNKASGPGISSDGLDEYDELFPNAVEIVLELGQASVSMLQRKLKLGYSRAARLVDQMEERGIVGPFGGSKPRQLLISKDQWNQMQGKPSMDTDNTSDSSSDDLFTSTGTPIPLEDESN